jgi:hypothetical protein
MTRTSTKPLDDKGMWRKAVAVTHPDGAGDHELCIWMQAVKEAVCNGESEAQLSEQPPPRSEPQFVHEDGRVPFPESVVFEELTAKALGVAAEVGGVFAASLQHLTNCHPMPHLAHEQERGASYKRLAYIAHLVGMSKGERTEWYRVAESIPFSDRHAAHILSKLKKRAA